LSCWLLGRQKSLEKQRHDASRLAPDPQAPLIANAWSEDGLVMAMRHAHAPAHGIQFHPESIGSEHGHAMLGAFLKLCVLS